MGALLLLAMVLPVQGQTQTTLDGVYNNSQAQRGARVYRNICSHCHEGGEPDADPLFGPDFIDRWREAPLSFLHGFFSRNMPGDEPGTLKDSEYLDVLAFLLKENGYPAGSANLSVEQLTQIQLVTDAGPQPMPANALVRVVGCLIDNKGDVALQQAALPHRVRRADEYTDNELALSTQEALGSGSYSLRNAEPDLAGHKVQVKGVWVPSGSGISLTVLSLEDTGLMCQ